MLTTLGLLAVVALIVANGYFVAGEFAYVAVRRTRLEELAGAGNRRAQRALDVVRRLSFMLSGAQLGITATSLVIGYIADVTLGRALRPVLELVGVPPQASLGIALTAGFAIATAAQMIFGELAPKNLAIAKPEAFALSLAASTRLWLRTAGPVISLFDTSANRLVRAVGIEPAEELSGAVSPEELELIISESSKEGHLTPGQAALLSRVLDFRELRAVDAMVPRTQIVAIPHDASCGDLRRIAAETGHSRFPVVGEGLDDVRGVVQAKDMLRVSVAERDATPVARLMSPPFAVPESALLSPLLAELRDAHSQLALVVDEYGGTAGIVTLEDVVEELVGDIQDEHDPTEPRAQALPDGSYLLPGSWRLDETERDTGVALPEGDYDTVGGLIMAALGRVPDTGDCVRLEPARLVVEAMQQRAVARVRLEPSAPPAPPDDQREEPTHRPGDAR